MAVKLHGRHPQVRFEVGQKAKTLNDRTGYCLYAKAGIETNIWRTRPAVADCMRQGWDSGTVRYISCCVQHPSCQVGNVRVSTVDLIYVEMRSCEQSSCRATTPSRREERLTIASGILDRSPLESFGTRGTEECSCEATIP